MNCQAFSKLRAYVSAAIPGLCWMYISVLYFRIQSIHVDQCDMYFLCSSKMKYTLTVKKVQGTSLHHSVGPMYSMP